MQCSVYTYFWHRHHMRADRVRTRKHHVMGIQQLWVVCDRQHRRRRRSQPAQQGIKLVTSHVWVTASVDHVIRWQNIGGEYNAANDRQGLTA